MKVAYLIIAHDNYKHLARLSKALNEEGTTFYVHIDKKSTVPILNADNIIFIEERVNVHWSGFSMVKAALNLLQRATKDENDFFALISGADYPIQPNSYLFEKLKKGYEYITTREGCDQYNPISRYKYFYFTDFYDRRDKRKLKTRFFLWLQKTLRNLKITKQIPFQLYTGTQWFILSRACVLHILNEVAANKTYVHFFKTAFCADECFFQTIVGNSSFLHKTKDSLTYADWSTRPGPAIITEKHLPVLKNEKDKFFARKFIDDSADLINAIEEMKLSKLNHRTI